jgi:hypothetical protein
VFQSPRSYSVTTQSTIYLQEPRTPPSSISRGLISRRHLVQVASMTWLTCQPVAPVHALQGCPVEARLYKVLVYQPGGHFAAHRDTGGSGDSQGASTYVVTVSCRSAVHPLANSVNSLIAHGSGCPAQVGATPPLSPLLCDSQFQILDCQAGAPCQLVILCNPRACQPQGPGAGCAPMAACLLLHLHAQRRSLACLARWWCRCQLREATPAVHWR